MNLLAKTTLALTAVAAATTGLAGTASAQTMRTEGPPPLDPVLMEAMLPRNEFVLYSDRNIELIRYSSPRDVEICIARPDPNTVFGTSQAVPVNVTWDNQTGEIWPGNCLSFDAQRVQVQPAQPLPEDTELRGTVKVIH